METFGPTILEEYPSGGLCLTGSACHACLSLLFLVLVLDPAGRQAPPRCTPQPLVVLCAGVLCVFVCARFVCECVCLCVCACCVNAVCVGACLYYGVTFCLCACFDCLLVMFVCLLGGCCGGA